MTVVFYSRWQFIGIMISLMLGVFYTGLFIAIMDRSKRGIKRKYSLLSVFCIITWLMFKILILISPNLEIMLIYMKLNLLILLIMSYLWNLYCFGKEKIPIMASIVIIVMTSFFELIGKKHVPLFTILNNEIVFDKGYYIVLGILIVFCIIGFIKLITKGRKTPKDEKKRFFILGVPLIFSIIINGIFKYLGLHFLIDVSILGLIIISLILVCLVYNLKLPDMVPSMQEKVLNYIDLEVILLDKYNRIVDFNNALLDKQIISLSSVNVEDLICNIKPYAVDRELALFEANLKADIDVEGKLNFNYLDNCIKYKYYINKLYSNENKKIGKVISFREVTRYYELLEELENKNSVLKSTYYRLAEYSGIVQENEAKRERERLLGEIHNTLGNSMDELIEILEVCRVMNENQSDKFKIKLNLAIEKSRAGLSEIRKSVTDLKRV